MVIDLQEQLILQMNGIMTEFLAAVGPASGQVVVLGCSTSEVAGQRIGSAGSEEIANAIVTTIKGRCDKAGVFLAVQCCEHLNRALVVEREVLEKYWLEEVAVIPMPKAGGACAATAMQLFARPVVVEAIQAYAGLDVGNTLIGMHLKPVVVPLRLAQCRLGQAWVVAAWTRPKFIGGQRAVYTLPQGGK